MYFSGEWAGPEDTMQRLDSQSEGRGFESCSGQYGKDVFSILASGIRILPSPTAKKSPGQQQQQLTVFGVHTTIVHLVLHEPLNLENHDSN